MFTGIIENVKFSEAELNADKTDFKIPLWSSPYAKKFESILIKANAGTP